MSIFNKPKKKIILISTGIALASALTLSPLLKADTLGGPNYLQQIAQYTNGILQIVDKLPQGLDGLTKLATVFTEPDDQSVTKSVTPIIQAGVTSYSGALLSSLGGQLTLQNQLLQDMFGPSAVANADDLSFQTLVGIPYSSTKPAQKGQATASGPGYNYVKNAAGMSLTHVVPGSWSGSKEDQQNYKNYYNTVVAVESFNAYVLSQLYTDATNGAVMQSRNTLLQQASDPKQWLTQMASEDLGYVAREQLIYTSAIYVMLSELLNTEKQLLTAQAMTNTLLVLTGQTNEQILLNKAKSSDS